jgi:hypothetical protein
MTKSRYIPLRMRKVLDKVVEKIKTHIYAPKLLSENRAVCEIMSKNMVETERSQYGGHALHAR